MLYLIKSGCKSSNIIDTNQCCVNHVDKLSTKPKNIVVFDKALLVFYLFWKHILETRFLFVWFFLCRSPNREYCDLLPVTINDNWRNWLKTPKGFIRNLHIFLLGTGAKSIPADWREAGAIYQLAFDQNVLSHNVKIQARERTHPLFVPLGFVKYAKQID